ncbi:ABC transporter substrate-binding protein [Arcobacter sp. CECT 8985]|uniref:ABC transporter substrate-binding protein n=1 Tax=Arcobacter sp. CECT 8985 TaxID=1935424 RepID=UPI00100B0D80|nr:ABC transporter substrate-binding protein [Arcobacter sp. CECT 8985]RXJ87104.1 ABC transporter substrate-binding protein [Arcobacter sp. CECT 8985]
MRKYLLIFLFSVLLFSNDSITYKYDQSNKIAINKRVKGSHLKVYMPTLAYFNIISLINGTLVRLSESKKGWEYYLAYKHKKIDDLTYDFWLRKDVRYQDGSKFDADSVVYNFKHFMKGPFLYSNIHNALDYVEKLNDYKIRIHLKEPYGMLLNDLCVVNFYTKQYYEKYNWTPSLAAQNTKGPGLYGAGPYILASGYASGLKQSKKIVLKANSYYFEKNKPYIETITIYTELTTKEVIDKISKKEGELDIAYIPFNKKTEIVNSKYAKLLISSSHSNLTVHMNLIKKNSKLKDIKVRQALNDALNQKNLIKFAFKNEAKESPFLLSSNTYFAKELSKKYLNRKSRFTQKQLHEILNGLELKVITQDRFMFVWKGIEYQLSKYGVKLDYFVTSDEKVVLEKLFNDRKNAYDWDLLIWGNDDWNGHPWTAFFTLYTKANWSSVDKDDYLVREFYKLFALDTNTPKFQKEVNKILLYSYKKAYTLVLPSPNIVIALNKEVIYKPSKMALFPLWNAKITPYHWSIRKGKLKKNRLNYLYPKRIK